MLPVLPLLLLPRVIAELEVEAANKTFPFHHEMNLWPWQDVGHHWIVLRLEGAPFMHLRHQEAPSLHLRHLEIPILHQQPMISLHHSREVAMNT